MKYLRIFYAGIASPRIAELAMTTVSDVIHVSDIKNCLI